jgi:hypothetical protein
MSVEAINGALASRIRSKTDLLVMLVLANHENGVTRRCNPSVPRVAQQCRLSERAVYMALARLEKGGHLSHIPGRGLNNSNHYSLHPKPEQGSPFEEAKPEPGSPQNLNGVQSKPEPGSLKPERGSPKQERNRKRTGMQKANAGRKPPESKPKIGDDEWFSSLRSDMQNQGVNIDAEYAKAAAWCKQKSRICSRRFFETWLKKADRPIAITTKPKTSSSTY